MWRDMAVVCLGVAALGCAATPAERLDAPEEELAPASPPVAGAVPPGPETAPNLLVVLLDDVGIDKLDAYRVAEVTPHTPTIDALAARGVTFDRAWAYATCSPTRAAIHTGQHPSQHGVGHAVSPKGRTELPDDSWTLPRMLDSTGGGWAHGAFGKWHLTGARGEGTVLQDPGDKGWGWFQTSEPPIKYFDWPKNDNGVEVIVPTYATTEVVDDALAFIGAQDGPWLAYVAFQAAHAPYVDPPEELVHTLDGDRIRDNFGRMVEAIDTELGRLIAGIPVEQLLRTTIVVLSDNGTPPNVRADGVPWEQSKGQPTEGGVRVPLIVAGPDVAEPGSRSSALVQSTDVFATAAELAGADLDDDLDAISLLPYLRDPGAPSLRQVQFTMEDKLIDGVRSGHHAVADADFKLVRYSDGTERLSDLRVGVWDDVDLLEGPLGVEAIEAYDRLVDALADR